MFRRKMSGKYCGRLVVYGVAGIILIGLAAFCGTTVRGWRIYRPWQLARGTAVGVKPTVNAETVIYKEIRYLCEDKVNTKIPTTSDLIGLDFASLAKKFPPDEGWSIDDTVKNRLVLVRVANRVCPYHQDFRHFGISDGFLAVYEGPLGFNQKVLQREEIQVSGLLPEMQADLGMAMEYNSQAPDTQGRLKSLYEFETEARLNEALENFDEYRE